MNTTKKIIKRVEHDLKPHNVATIEKILEFYKTERKCCAIQATGTGKTFLILRLLEIYNDEGKNAVIFAPNNEIIKQTKKRMKKFGLNNAAFYTYQKLAKMTNEEIASMKFDLIVCDELHRTGAKTWGQKFEVLVNSHPDSKVFGVTATPLRCADGRDMSEEYFDGNKACDISLAEALVREIIPVMPLYVSALYTFEEEYQNMSEKIEKANNSVEEKIELQKELLVAKQQLEKANGVPEIIKKYITNYNGKYLVFCKDKKHLYAMKDVVVSWFREAGYNGEIYEYPYYSNSSTVKKNLENFENNKDDGLKLLFIIDKLNEGLHLDEVHGCILLRTTTSNIIYYQQIGRAIDAGSMEKRVILDLVSNFNSLKSFNLKKELEQKAKERRNGNFFDCSDKFELDKFDVVDCVQECIDVFNQIDLKLRDSFYERVEELRLYKEKNGDLLFDSQNSNIEQTRLSKFCCRCRNLRKSGELSEDRIEILDSIGFVWNPMEYRIDIGIEHMKTYFDTYGNYDIKTSYISPDGYKLGLFVRNHIKSYRDGVLEDYKVDKFTRIGYMFNMEKRTFSTSIDKCRKLKELLIDYHNVYGTFDTRINPIFKGENINSMCSRIRCRYKEGKISHELYQELLSVGFIDNLLEYDWENNFNLLKECVKNSGNISNYEGKNLKLWLHNQTRSLKSGFMSNEKYDKLKILGFDLKEIA